MGELTVPIQTGNMIQGDYDFSQFLQGNNEFTKLSVTASGADVVLEKGELMGQIAATALAIPMIAAAVDGSQYPVGAVIEDITVVDGTTKVLNLVNKGSIDKDMLVFNAAEGLATTVGPASNLKTYEALLNDLGLILESVEQNAGFDN